MENLFYLFLALIGFGFLVFLHELGHYFVGRREKMEVEVFSIGFGKPFFKWMRKGVQWQVCWVPFGGFVKFKGMDKEHGKEVHEIEGGFFQKTPLSRIKVALAGPIVNFIVAFIFFTIIWVCGGRQMSFQESTHVVGFVKPQSKLYELGIRPGDVISKVNGQSLTNFQDIIQAAVTSPDDVTIEGYSLKETEKKPFKLNYKINIDPNEPKKTLERIQSILPARYLIYDAEKKFPIKIDHLPIQKAGIQNNDRVLWVDGSMVYSQEELQSILTEKAALLTIQRKEKIFVVKVPKLFVEDYYLNEKDKNEIEDWSFEQKLNKSLSKVYFIPCTLSISGVIESKLQPIDGNPPLFNEGQLEIGDRILAVDGKGCNNAYEILSALQTRKHLIVVQRNHQLLNKSTSKEDEDEVFESTLQKEDVLALVNQIGTTNQKNHLNDLHLLKPIEAVTIEQMVLQSDKAEELSQEIKMQKTKILRISNYEKRSEMLNLFEKGLHQPLLGLMLKDRMVDYNPNPVTSFMKVFQDSFKTLKALITGQTSPKWMSGPVGIFQVMHTGFSIGIKQGLFWMATISLALGFSNLIPIPPLDGGHVIFSIYELASRKRITSKMMQKITLPFFILLISLLIFVTFQDLSRLFGRFF
jgi:regulator of sigma E protease